MAVFPLLSQVRDFRFLWPVALLLLVLPPLWWWAYARQVEKKLRATALAFSYAAVAAQIAKGMPVQKWRRLLYPLTVSSLLACLVLALARPVVTAHVPVQSADVMMVMDISLSMMADDLRPTRLDAAKQAAVDFVRGLPDGMRVGLEVFAGEVYVLSPPTRNHREIIDDLDALRKEDLKPRTEIGTALHTALRVLARQKSKDSEKKRKPGQEDISKPEAVDENASSQEPSEMPSKRSGKPRTDRAIILLSDGDSHEGYPWDRAAEDARKVGVTIDAIGIGSLKGSSITYQGMVLPVSFDERTLHRIADIANGQYFRVTQARDFQAAYRQIQAHTVHEEEQDVELTFLFATLALAVLITSLGLSLRYSSPNN